MLLDQGSTLLAGLHDHPASFDKLRMRDNLGGTKKHPHPELVEGRTAPIPVSGKRVERCLARPHVQLSLIRRAVVAERNSGGIQTVWLARLPMARSRAAFWP